MVVRGAAECGHLNRVWDAFEVCGSGAQIRHLNRLLGSDRSGHRALRMQTKDLIGSCCGKRRRHIVERHLTYRVILNQGHRSELRAANARRVLQHLLEYGSQIAGR